MRLTHPLWRARPLVLAIVATIGAAGLVLYFQYRAIAALESQTRVIVRQISEQAAAEIANELRRDAGRSGTRHLDGGQPARSARGTIRPGGAGIQERARGLSARRSVPGVERRHRGETPGEVLFFGRDGRFERDPALGRAVFALARRHAPAQHIYIAAEGVGPGKRHQVLLRVFWNDAQRLDYFAVLGLVVDPQTMPARVCSRSRGGRGSTRVLTRRTGDAAAAPAGDRRTWRARLRQRRCGHHQQPRSRSRCCSIPPRTSSRACPAAPPPGHGRSRLARRRSPARWPA